MSDFGWLIIYFINFLCEFTPVADNSKMSDNYFSLIYYVALLLWHNKKTRSRSIRCGKFNFLFLMPADPRSWWAEATFFLYENLTSHDQNIWYNMWLIKSGRSTIKKHSDRRSRNFYEKQNFKFITPYYFNKNLWLTSHFIFLNNSYEI